MAATGSIDAYLTFGTCTAGSKSFEIKGESSDSYEQGFTSCQVSSYNLGFGLDTAPGMETDNPHGETATHAPELRPIEITKPVDSASPVIMQAMTKAGVFDEVWLWQRKPTGAQAKASKDKLSQYFWKIHLQKVYIADLQWTADADSLTETLKLAYQKIDVQYYRQLPTGDLEQKPIKGQYPEDNAKLSVVKSKTNSADYGEIEQKILKKLKDLNPKLNLRIS
jgi:type VI secretion system Hcp family effector